MFPAEQIKIYLYEEWKHKPQAMLRDLFHFLEVDQAFTPVIQSSNVTRLPKNQWLHYLSSHPAWLTQRAAFLPPFARKGITSSLQYLENRFNLAPPPPLEPATRARLTANYREDILKLQTLIQRDLSGWLEIT